MAYGTFEFETRFSLVPGRCIWISVRLFPLGAVTAFYPQATRGNATQQTYFATSTLERRRRWRRRRRRRRRLRGSIHRFRASIELSVLNRSIKHI